MKKIFILFLSISTSILAIDSITPIPLENNYNIKKALLGKKLFFDTSLSKDGTISCASCHTLPGGGANHTALSYGVNGAEGLTNSPTVLNSVYNFAQFWDGRASSLKDQVIGPIENPLEMASNMRRVTKIVKRDKKYKKEFDDIYENGVNSDNIIDAIAVFESALTTPNARFDKYLRGDVHALSKQEKKGYKRFIELGCINCHNGVNVGGNMYQKAGIMSNLSSNNKYLGRYNVTKREKDKYVYKVPSLRNIELTAPYFHDGSVNSLREAVYKMGIYQLGIVIGDKDLDDIVAFLKTLTGQSPKILEK